MPKSCTPDEFQTGKFTSTKFDGLLSCFFAAIPVEQGPLGLEPKLSAIAWQFVGHVFRFAPFFLIEDGVIAAGLRFEFHEFRPQHNKTHVVPALLMRPGPRQFASELALHPRLGVVMRQRAYWEFCAQFTVHWGGPRSWFWSICGDLSPERAPNSPCIRTASTTGRTCLGRALPRCAGGKSASKACDLS